MIIKQKQKVYIQVMFTKPNKNNMFTDKLCLQNKKLNKCLQNKSFQTRYVHTNKNLLTGYVNKTKNKRLQTR